MSASAVPQHAQAATPPILFDPEGDVLTTDTLTTIIEEGRPMLNDYLRYAKVGGGQHGEVYLCQRLNAKAAHGDPDRRIPVAMKSVKRNNPRAEQLQNLRKKRFPSSPHTVVADKLNTTEEKIRREIAIMKKLRHAHVVRLYEVIDDRIQDKIYIVMEYLGGGEVKWRDDQNRPVLTVSQTRRILRDAVLGLEYLHHQGIIHRDIKPANLLWTEDRRQVKIGDFGVSHFSYAQRLAAAGGRDINDNPHDPILLDESGLTRRAGTPSFLAPEVISEHVNESGSLFSSTSQSPSSDSSIHGSLTTLTTSPTTIPTPSTGTWATTTERPQITKSIDIWALGVTMYCLLFGDTPFHSAQSQSMTGSEFSLYNAICNDDWGVPQSMGYERLPTGGRHPNLSSENASTINLLDQFLQKDYRLRITLDDVKRHSWLLKDLNDPTRWITITSPKASPIDVSVNETSDAMSVVHFRWRWGGRLVQQVSSLFRGVRPLTRQEVQPGPGIQRHHRHRREYRGTSSVGINSFPESRSRKSASLVHLNAPDAAVPFPGGGHGSKSSGPTKKDKGKAKADQNQQQHQPHVPRTLKRLNSKGGGSKSLRSKSIERWPSADPLQRSNTKARRGSDTKIWTGEIDVPGSSRTASGSSATSPTEKRARFASIFQGISSWRPNKYASASTSTTKHHVVVASPTEYTQLQSSQMRTFVVGSSSDILLNPTPNTRRSEEALRYYGQSSTSTGIGSTGPPLAFVDDDPANAGALLTAARRASSWGQGDKELTELVSVQSVGQDLNEHEMNVGAGGIAREGISVPPVGALTSVVAASASASEAVAKAIVNSRRLSVTPLAAMGSGSGALGGASGGGGGHDVSLTEEDIRRYGPPVFDEDSSTIGSADHDEDDDPEWRRGSELDDDFFGDNDLPDDDDNASHDFSDQEEEEEEGGVTFSPRRQWLNDQ